MSIYPKVFELVKNDTNVQTYFGTNPVRVFPFGFSPEDYDKLGTYAVWQTISGVPANSLSCPPSADDWSVQIDVYGKDVKNVREAAKSLIDVLEKKNWITNIRGDSRDFETKNYRYSFDVQILQNR